MKTTFNIFSVVLLFFHSHFHLTHLFHIFASHLVISPPSDDKMCAKSIWAELCVLFSVPSVPQMLILVNCEQHHHHRSSTPHTLFREDWINEWGKIKDRMELSSLVAVLDHYIHSWSRISFRCWLRACRNTFCTLQHCSGWETSMCTGETDKKHPHCRNWATSDYTTASHIHDDERWSEVNRWRA